MILLYCSFLLTFDPLRLINIPTLQKIIINGSLDEEPLDIIKNASDNAGTLSTLTKLIVDEAQIISYLKTQKTPQKIRNITKSIKKT